MDDYDYIYWLRNQKNRDDIIGDLAQDYLRPIKYKVNRHLKSNTYNQLKTEMRESNCDREAMYALYNSWFEFSGVTDPEYSGRPVDFDLI